MPKKVLLIDYEPRSVERVRSLLPNSEYAVVEARDGEEGLSAFSASRYDAVVLAGMLPRLPTAEVIREIRRKGGATAPPILLMVSGYKGNNRKADAQRVGAFDLLPRPFTDEDFRESMNAAIESTNVGAKTLRIPLREPAPPASLTASDIFSDVLQEVGGEPVSATAPPARSSASTEDEVERRLRDTLSGILPGRSGARSGSPSSSSAPVPTPPSSSPRFSTDADIERMISDTLSGLKAPARARESSGARAEKAAPAVSGSGPDRFGQYEIVERIASGGMAELYKARKSGVEGFEKILAVKKILPHLADNDEFIGMFADEAKLAALLNHPNIVHIFDLGKIDSGGYFIAMEFVEGRDLRSILQSARAVGTPMPIPLAVYVACKVASALDYAHRRRDADGRELRIVHRDVSPQNILISYEGDIKLCDFGIAKAASKASQTESGALKGKVRYMSPEQAWGKPIDRRSDLFSLGAVLYEMLTDQALFSGDTDLNVLEKVRAAEVVAPSTLNPEISNTLDTIVLKALARDPEDRYANASDMLRDLEAVLYAHAPAPGSADLAIYLHRLQAEEAAAQESRAREAAQAIPAEPERKRKSKVVPVARRATGSAPNLVVPAASKAAASSEAAPERAIVPGVFGASSDRPVEAERRSRLPLYLLIAAATIVLAAGIWLVARKSSAPGPAPVARATPLPAEPTVGPPSAPTAVAGALPVPTLNAKAIDDEVQRQLATKKKELQKALEASKASRESSSTAARKEVAEPEPTAVPVAALPEPTIPRAEPTAVPVAEAPPTAAPVARIPPQVREAEVVRGELVGPGPGVVEPSLVSPPKVAYPPLARQQRVSGKVIVLVLVDPEGGVADVRLQQGIASRTGVNEAVMQGVRTARFQPATKNGVPVRMWRTVVVDVKP